MAKKPFKGGNLDDFVNAGEAEARYGPQRYAAVYEDLRKLQVPPQALNAKFRDFEGGVMMAMAYGASRHCVGPTSVNTPNARKHLRTLQKRPQTA